MKVLSVLRALGDRLGILEVAANRGASSPARRPTRTISLEELTTEIRSEAIRALAGLPLESAAPFGRIFEAAGIAPPPHGWDIGKLQELLRSKEYSSMHRAEARERLAALLSEQKVPAADLVKDAIARDQALDAFEDRLRQRMAERSAAGEKRMAALDEEIRHLERERKETAARLESDREALEAWLRDKRAHEQELAETVSFLVDGPVITR